MSRYAIITGHGRSGTNWLLSIMNASTLTHCRNEPDGAAGSPLKPLISEARLKEDLYDFEKRWDEAAHWTTTHMGDRDSAISNAKLHVYTLSQKLGLCRMVSHPKIRCLLKLLASDLGHGEWKMPWWIGDQKKLEDAYAILKINMIADLAPRLFEDRPDVPILHIVRHPAGFLNSLRNRYASNQNESQHLQTNRDRLKVVVKKDKPWGVKFGEIDSLGIVETELWYWRYLTEQIYLAGIDRSNYLRIVYESLAKETIKFARSAYEFCGLPWTESVESIIHRGTKRTSLIAERWRKTLVAEDKETVEKVLRGSLMEDWW